MRKAVILGSVSASFLVYQYSQYGILVNPFTGKRQFVMFNDTLEAYIGERTAHEAYERLRESILTESCLEYKIVHAVTRKLTEQISLERDWKVTVVDDPHINAFVTANGRVFVYTGLLQALDSVDELGQVIGHELSHVYLRHSFTKMSVSHALQGLWCSYQVVVNGGVCAAQSTSVEFPSNLTYSKRQEIEADQYGMTIALNAGYRLDSCSSVLKNLTSAEAKHADLFILPSITDPRVKAVADQRMKLMNKYSTRQMEDLHEKVKDTELLFKQYKLASKTRSQAAKQTQI